MSTVADTLEPDMTVDPARPSFCRRCGQAMAPASLDCECVNTARQPMNAVPADPDRPTLRAALWLYFAMLGFSMATIVVVRANHGLDIDARFELLLSAGFAMIVLPWAVRYRKYLVPLLRPRGHIGWYGLACVTPLATFGLAVAVIHFFEHWLKVPALDETGHFGVGGYGFGCAVLSFCFAPAVTEEIAFRGIIFDGLSTHLSVIETALVSATIFAILHLSILSLPHLLCIGLLLALLRAKTASLLPGMIAHFLHNFLVCGNEWSEGRWPW